MPTSLEVMAALAGNEREHGSDAMNLIEGVAVPVACDVCGLEPCLTPGFCQGCRAAHGWGENPGFKAAHVRRRKRS